MASLTQLYLYLTEGCNLACRHCWLNTKYKEVEITYPVHHVVSVQKKYIFIEYLYQFITF